MLMSLLSHILCAWFAFLLPSYATFKALAHRPLSEPELQRWTMYWSVLGVFVAFEYAAEWLISWLPFYWEVKTLFLLYLALPQTQGSTYIYTTYLQPFFIQNEANLDEGIVQAQKNVLTFVQSRLVILWEWLLNTANKRQTATSTAAGSSNAQANGNAFAPTALLQGVFGLWQTYGNSVMSVMRSPGGTRAAASASSSSIQPSPAIAATQRGSAQDNNNSYDGGNASIPSGNPNPSFPEPQDFS